MPQLGKLIAGTIFTFGSNTSHIIQFRFETVGWFKSTNILLFVEISPVIIVILLKIMKRNILVRFTSISLTCSYWTTCACRTCSSKSLFLSNRTLPSCAANWRSEKHRTERYPNYNYGRETQNRSCAAENRYRLMNQMGLYWRNKNKRKINYSLLSLELTGCTLTTTFDRVYTDNFWEEIRLKLNHVKD